MIENLSSVSSYYRILTISEDLFIYFNLRVFFFYHNNSERLQQVAVQECNLFVEFVLK